jgi:hypothetical protein
MGSLVGKITGATSVGQKAQRGYQEAGDMAQFKPWNVSGSYFGGADFDYKNNTASYNLSPELEQLRDMFMNPALKGVDEGAIAEGDYFKKTGFDMFKDALSTDVSREASGYYDQIQDIMAPGRAKNEQRLANNLFASGRMGAGSAAYEGGGYVNPERLEYLTAMNREDSKLGMESYDKARNNRYEDMAKGLGYYGTGNQMRLQPYNDVYSLFGMGSGVETSGQNPFKLGMGLGDSALAGDKARAAMYGMGANAMYETGASSSGAFTNLIGTGLQAYGAGGGFGSTIGAGFGKMFG